MADFAFKNASLPLRASKSWKNDHPDVSGVNDWSKKVKIHEQAMNWPGVKGSTAGSAWTKEARSFVHSVPTHEVHSVEGKGKKFKDAAEKAGYRVSTKSW